MAEIQILISAYGADDLNRIASLPHPRIKGLEYIVGWQNYGAGVIPESLNQRTDFKVYFNDSVGLSNNRNFLLDQADGDIAVISDSDLSYSPDNIETIREALKKYPDYDFLTFKYASDFTAKDYPTHTFELDRPPRGYYVSSVELVLNLKRIKEYGKISDWRFNPNFGVNGKVFGSGEEDILIASALGKGYKGRYVPQAICFHPGDTTSDRLAATREFIETKGAVFSYIKPWSWFPRMIVHAMRAKKLGISFPFYCRWWLSGIMKARKNHVFADEKK